jgi:hypothetical protein
MSFAGIEVYNFKRHLGGNEQWIRSFFEERGLADKYDELIRSDSNLGTVARNRIYAQLQRELFAYLDSSIGTNTQSVTQAKLRWWILRGVSVALVVVAAELVIIIASILILQFYSNPSLGNSLRFGLIAGVGLLAVVVGFLAVMGSLKVGRLIVRHAHSQMCYELFSHVGNTIVRC